MIHAMIPPGNPLAAIAGVYAAAFEEGFRFWMQQAQLWRGALSGAGFSGAPELAGGGPLGGMLRGMAGPWLEPMTIRVAEMDERVALSATYRDVRIDMMITHLPDAAEDAPVTLEGVAERLDAAKLK